MREPSRVRVTGPLEPFAEQFIAELEEAGYRPAAAAVQVRVLAHLSAWMQDEEVAAGGLREADLERFRREHLVRFARVRGAGIAVVLGYLRGLAVVRRALGCLRGFFSAGVSSPASSASSASVIARSCCGLTFFSPGLASSTM